ncbi:MAG: hypothetical protein GTO18_21170 [Anaerolineales bacterium]|nr:hypothetical protein [Anaerolineales bacterium]
MNREKYLRLAEVVSVLLFFIQALRVMFSVLFGVIYDGVFAGPFTAWLVISVLLVLLAFLAPAVGVNRLQVRHLSILAILTVISRIALSVNIADVRYWGALALLFFGGLYIGGILRYSGWMALYGIVIAFCLDQLLRIAGHTYDVSLDLIWIPILVIWIFVLAFWALRLRGLYDFGGRPGGISIIAGLSFGAFLFMETSLLSVANAVARWGVGSYTWIAPILLLLTLIFLFAKRESDLVKHMLERSSVRALFALLLLTGLMLGYFVSGAVAVLGLLIAQVATLFLLPFLFDGATGEKRTGIALALGLVLFLVLNFLNAFAFTYPYTLPAMREMGWAVFLAAALVFCWEVLRSKSRLSYYRVDLSDLAKVLLVLSIIVVVPSIWPQTADHLAEEGSLRSATYNIHYGYDNEWHFTLADIAETIQQNDCDVVAMQEVDTGRMTSYMVDNAYYLARKLRMQVAYLPTVEHLTGIAVLYRGPKAVEEGQLLTSLQEQTGIVHVLLEEGGATLHAYGTWLGLSNEDTQQQIDEALAFIGDASPATFGGDFNAESGSPVITTIENNNFEDPFALLGIPAPPTSPAEDPDSRIDYVWIRNLKPAEAWVPDSITSDHRMVVVEVEFP